MAENRGFFATWLMAGVAAAGAAGCHRAPETRQTQPITPTYNQQTGRLERITYDRNRDGKVDAWTFMNGTTVVRAELDDNYDGMVDRWEFYAPPAPGAPVTDATRAALITRVELAARGDGKVSRWEYYAGGALTRAEEDSDDNGRIDKWETWDHGTLVSVALDTTGHGRPDRRILYGGDDGPRFETDPDGTGRFRPAAGANAAR